MSRYHGDGVNDVAYTDLDGTNIIVSLPEDSECRRGDCERRHFHVLSDDELRSLLGLASMAMLTGHVDNSSDLWDWLNLPRSIHDSRPPLALLNEDNPHDWNLMVAFLSDGEVVDAAG
jgi:hypothetical protein